SGSGGSSNGSKYAVGDLPAIFDAAPTMTNWRFEKGDPYINPLKHAPAFTLSEWLRDLPTNSQRASAHDFKKAGFQIGRPRVWNGEVTPPGRYTLPADAVAYAFLFRHPSGAEEGLRALQTATRDRVASLEKGTKDLSASGLGDESFAWYEPSGDNGNES